MTFENNSAPAHEPPCTELGYLMVSGKRVAVLRCDALAGHGARHFAAFDWDDAAPEIADDWPERYDPDEVFDVDVPLLEPDDDPLAIARGRYVDRIVDGLRESGD